MNFNFYKFFFVYTFVSLVTPWNLISLRFFFKTLNSKKIYIKQSYLFLTWFYYMTLNFSNTTKKSLISFLPKKKKKYTLIKAPMAHKNWSKEQFIMQQFKFNFKFNFKFKYIANINQFFFFFFLSKKNCFFPETNLFWLKTCAYFLWFKDHTYFNLISFK